MACKNPFLEAERARKRESPARRHRGRPGQDRRGLRAGPAAAARPGHDRRARGQGPEPPQGRQALHHRHRRGSPSATPGTRTPSPPRPPWTASTCCAPASTPGDLDSGEVVSSYKALAQVERAFRAFNTDLDIRPDPAPHRGPGPRARVLADAVVLHHLAHAGPARARSCSPTTTSPPPRPPGPARSPPPPAPRAPWPRPPPSTPPATSRCTASPPCSPTWAPSA